jgi:hypothetical protein
MLEFVDYRRVHLEPSILVDRSRGEKLVIEMDISFLESHVIVSYLRPGTAGLYELIW